MYQYFKSKATMFEVILKKLDQNFKKLFKEFYNLKPKNRLKSDMNVWNNKNQIDLLNWGLTFQATGWGSRYKYWNKHYKNWPYHQTVFRKLAAMPLLLDQNSDFG